MTADLLTMIRRACEGTPAEGLEPYVNPTNRSPVCVRECPHHSALCCAVDGGLTTGLCIPAVEALARLAVEGAAEIDRLTEALRVATASPLPVSSGGVPLSAIHRDPITGAWLPAPPPVAVERVELVWVHAEAETWQLMSGDQCRSFGFAIGPIACRAMAAGWIGLGYRVPKHPLGWHVGGER